MYIKYTIYTYNLHFYLHCGLYSKLKIFLKSFIYKKYIRDNISDIKILNRKYSNELGEYFSTNSVRLYNNLK